MWVAARIPAGGENGGVYMEYSGHCVHCSASPATGTYGTARTATATRATHSARSGVHSLIACDNKGATVSIGNGGKCMHCRR